MHARPLPHTPPHAVTLSGLGVHSGRPCSATVSAAPVGAGITFASAAGSFRATPDHVLAATMQTRLGTAAFSVGTTEHLLSACHGLGVWDLLVTVVADELPILDGSALPWAHALAALPTAAPPPLQITAPVEVRDGSRLARLEPADGCFISASLTPRPALTALGPTEITLELTPDTYLSELAWARTYVFEADAERLRAAGYGAGADLDNTLLLGPTGPRNPAGSRGPSEPLRHKILDALGDLALLGAPFRGRLVLHDSGHALHTALARTLLEDLP